MSKNQVTSVSIPRFDAGLHIEEHLGFTWMPKEREALIYFSIGLKMGGVDKHEISTWARAYTYTRKHTPDWIWDILDREMDIENIIQRTMPFHEAAEKAEWMMAVIEKLIEKSKIELPAALPHIANLKWQGQFPELPTKSSNIIGQHYEIIASMNDALSRLLDSWNRVEVLGVKELESNESIKQELQDRYEKFIDIWRQVPKNLLNV